MAGMDATTGKILEPWPAAVQRFGIILSTRKGSRVMARDIGCEMVALLDRPISPVTTVDFFSAVAEAADLEPCIKIKRMGLTNTGEIDRPAIDVALQYFPRGHLGDFSESQDRAMRITL